MQVSYVPIDKMGLDAQIEVWTQILPFVRKLVKQANGRITETSVLEECRTGKVGLWICYDEVGETIVPGCFICTKVHQYPSGKRLMSYEYCGGERIEDWFDQAHELISKWAMSPQSAGGPECHGMEIIGRLGWQRYLKPKGWDQVFAVYEKSFDAET